MATETLSEAEKQRRVPGVYFATEPTGRCAKLAGTGLGVWEIIKAFKAYGEDLGELVAYYDWLSREQLDTAFRYWREFPSEIDERVALEYAYTPEEIWAQHPFTRPPHHAAN